MSIKKINKTLYEFITDDLKNSYGNITVPIEKIFLKMIKTDS